MDVVDIEDSSGYLRPRLTVYLASSLTTDDNRPLKEAVLRDAERIFREAGFIVYNPAGHTLPGSPHTSAEVYFEDLWHTINSDFICFVRLGRSLGMGIEAQIGADVLLPWADIRRDDDLYQLSPLLSGLSNAAGIFHVFVNADEPGRWHQVLADALRDPARLDRLFAAKQARDSAQALINDFAFGREVRFYRLVRGLSTADLGKLTDIDPTWIQAIEADPRYVSKLSLIQVMRLCDALQLRLARSNGGLPPTLPKFEPPRDVSQALVAEVRSYVDYSYETGSPPTLRPTDDGLMSRWKTRLAEKGVELPRFQAPGVALDDGPIRISVCPPMSNFTGEEEAGVASLVASIRQAAAGCVPPAIVESPQKRPGRHDSGAAIYLKWVERLRHTDLAIVVLDPPATGVGVMLQLFQNATVPCLCIVQDWSEVSRMVRGLAPDTLAHLEVKSTDSLRAELANWIRDNGNAICESRSRRERAWERLGALSVRRAAALGSMVRSPAAKMPCLRDELLEQLVDHEHMIGAVTLLQLAYIAKTQNWNLVPNTVQGLEFEPSLNGTGLTQPTKLAAARTSLMNLRAALDGCDPPIAGEKAARAWDAYLHELSSGAARKERHSQTVESFTRSTEQWVRMLRAGDEL